jgi:hypothetical protein
LFTSTQLKKNIAATTALQPQGQLDITINKQWGHMDGEMVLIVTSNDDQLQEEAMTTGGERHGD